MRSVGIVGFPHHWSHGAYSTFHTNKQYIGIYLEFSTFQPLFGDQWDIHCISVGSVEFWAQDDVFSRYDGV